MRLRLHIHKYLVVPEQRDFSRSIANRDRPSLSWPLTYCNNPTQKLALPCHPFLTSTNNLLVQTSGKDCDQMKSKVVGTLRSLPLIFPIKYLMAVNGEIGIELFGINLIDCRLRHCLLLPCC